MTLNQAPQSIPPCEETLSGIPVKEVYTPDDVSHIDYQSGLADPGDYPFTRGLFRSMYRTRDWARREIVGMGTPPETNERLKYLLKQGATGLNIIFDVPTFAGIDPDHPKALRDIGQAGVNICCLHDAQTLFEGLPLDKVNLVMHNAALTNFTMFPLVVAEAKRQGCDISLLKGTTMNVPLHMYAIGFKKFVPLEIALRTAVDVIEFSARHMPRYNLQVVHMYDLRECGMDMFTEVAAGFANLIAYVEGTLARGLDIDEFAPRLALVSIVHMDFFEEIAKLRAIRRIWARMMKERWGAKDRRSLTCRIGIHTAGDTLMPQQPLNNIVRVTYQTMAAALAGVQAIEACTYDEPLGLPSEEAHKLALRTQQVLAYESGITRVSDPLGGSYYLEHLTDEIEQRSMQKLAEIEAMGGIVVAMQNGWLQEQSEHNSLLTRKKIDEGKQIIVGVNAFADDEELRIVSPSRVSLETQRAQVERIRSLKETRDQQGVRTAIGELRHQAESGEKENLVPWVIKAYEADATVSEILGTVREAYGYSYDPFERVNNPFS